MEGFLNPLDERFSGRDEDLGAVGGMLRKIHDDSEVLQDRRYAFALYEVFIAVLTM